MKFHTLILLCIAILFAADASAQSQANMLKSKDVQLAKNKRFVYDFWREVFEGGHMDLVNKYMAESYIQHNPNVPTGRKAFVDFFSKFAKPISIVDSIKAPLIAITADGDLVTLVFKQENPDPKETGKKYTTTWFDMFRIENGKIAEHWDPALKQ
jgi:predicted SnoaL-like aldol condensation-catalyzing enzyme